MYFVFFRNKIFFQINDISIVFELCSLNFYLCLQGIEGTPGLPGPTGPEGPRVSDYEYNCSIFCFPFVVLFHCVL